MQKLLRSSFWVKVARGFHGDNAVGPRLLRDHALVVAREVQILVPQFRETPPLLLDMHR